MKKIKLNSRNSQISSTCNFSSTSLSSPKIHQAKRISSKRDESKQFNFIPKINSMSRKLANQAKKKSPDFENYLIQAEPKLNIAQKLSTLETEINNPELESRLTSPKIEIESPLELSISLTEGKIQHKKDPVLQKPKQFFFENSIKEISASHLKNRSEELKKYPEKQLKERIISEPKSFELKKKGKKKVKKERISNQGENRIVNPSLKEDSLENLQAKKKEVLIARASSKCYEEMLNESESQRSISSKKTALNFSAGLNSKEFTKQVRPVISYKRIVKHS